MITTVARSAAPVDSLPSKGTQTVPVELVESLNAVLADLFALYLKTKNFHWHVSGAHFRDYHLLFDDHATEIVATTDSIAERVRKIGGETLRSIGDVSRTQRLHDNDSRSVPARAMLEELMSDNAALSKALRETHRLADGIGDVASASLLEVWIDEADRRVWFLKAAAT